MRKKREIVERITVTGKGPGEPAAIMEYRKDGYEVKMLPVPLDGSTDSKFKFIAEKVIS